MNCYTVLEGSTELYQSVFERFLFNEVRHRQSQSTIGWTTFSLVHAQKKIILAQIHFCVTNEIASSPYRAPFGSLEFDEMLSEELYHFFVQVEEKLKAKGVKKIMIKDVAQQFRPQHSALLQVLFYTLGYRTTAEEINSAIEIDDTHFEDKIFPPQRRRLKLCKRENLVFKNIDIQELNTIYSFLANCRSERGTSLSLSLSQVQAIITHCPNDFLLFGVFKDNELIAASISIKVNHRILYNFYPGHAQSVDLLSPAIFLIEGIYAYCRRHKFSFLDLGTSSLNNKINFGLLNFKRHVGGKMSAKFTFEKELY